MSQPSVAHTSSASFDHEVTDSKSLLGFWIYLMTDLILFATLFATYAVLQGGTFGGPSARELFDLPYVLVETLVLLTSSFTCGLAILAMQDKRKNLTLVWLAITLILGAIFLSLELAEFAHLINDGNSWTRSGFLSAYFTLVGTHGAHIAVGLLWGVVVIVQLWRKGLTSLIVKRLKLFSLFWHFLDIVWILIFTFVYLIGVSS